MRLEPLCRLELRYVGGFHLARPYGGESGTGWGQGDGTVTGERLVGTVRWSNHPTRRGDGAMLPDVRGVIATRDGAEVLFGLRGRTVFSRGDDPPHPPGTARRFVEREGEQVGRQLLAVELESEAEPYAWLNDTFCVGEGVIDLDTLTSRVAVSRCVPEG